MTMRQRKDLRKIQSLKQDGRAFKDLLPEGGNWSHLAANKQGIPGVYCANWHEKAMLRFGRFVFSG